MNKTLKFALLATLALGLVALAACSSDDGGTAPPPVDDTTWLGTWLSAGNDVAPLLVTLFNYDSVRVTFNENNTVVLESHPEGGAWTTLNGVYDVTESPDGSIDAIAINYSAFEQEGIIEVFKASPDSLLLEAVQTVPDIGAVPPTPADGFGANAALGTTNVQRYRRVATDPWVGTWLSAGDNVAPLLVTLFDYDSVRVTLNENNTVMLETHPSGGSWSTLNGVYTVNESATGDIDAIAINYSAFEQEGIVEIYSASPDSMWLEVVQTVPDIGAVPPTPADGFGANAALGMTNIQRYERTSF